ncbi:hypothetical protein GGE16_003028 [Rhizobium leguminosarum]|uniref:Uncharacterized protein n=1 Tax=Rhizobium leguminosarum TaxID=384 RepID=A0AAE2SXX2_RHILE|nr:hypothetical protein [Rhizobium leguminosarum]MBB4430120.1 hypothetical protein [Rhizobium esperanzae]MBB4297935.1 hypothetical protein [Rhizobium leguminosarum]MBB4309074.1 hypothetical protein [Rhizobium leguminosarum]MBB4416911.1 hypothetical protein [Rhizobium leguminosarum]
MSFEASYAPNQNIISDWPVMNFKAYTNPAKNDTVRRNYRDAAAFRTELFFTLLIGQI